MFPLCASTSMHLHNIPMAFLCCVALYNFAILQKDYIPEWVLDISVQDEDVYSGKDDVNREGRKKGNILRNWLVQYMN